MMEMKVTQPESDSVSRGANNRSNFLLHPRARVRRKGLHGALQLQREVGTPVPRSEKRNEPSLPAGMQLQGEWTRINADILAIFFWITRKIFSQVNYSVHRRA